MNVTRVRWVQNIFARLFIGSVDLLQAYYTYGETVAVGTLMLGAIAEYTNNLLQNSAPPPAGNFPRGQYFEEVANVNLGGNIKAIDAFASTEGGIDVLSLRSHNLGTPQGLISAIRGDAFELRDKIQRSSVLQGRDRFGNVQRFQTTSIQARTLLVVVPETQQSFLSSPAFRGFVAEIAEGTETFIRVVPKKGWK